MLGHETLEDRRLLAADYGIVSVNLPAGGGVTEVAVENGQLIVRRDGNILLQQPSTDITSLTINGTDNDDDTLDLNVTDLTFPSGGIFFNGGIFGNDDLKLSGGAFDVATFTFDNENDGSIDLDGSLITYTGLEPILSTITATDVIFNFSGGDEVITLGDDGDVGDNESQIDSTLGESVVFVNPTNSLTVNSGSGDDAIYVSALDASFAASLIIDGGDSDYDELTMTGVDLINTPGRGLTLSELEFVTITGGTISGNTATIGGGILLNNSTSGTKTSVSIDGTIIDSNTATGNAANQGGGGIYNDGVDLIISGALTMITNNNATGTSGSGGGIFNNGVGTIHISDASVSGNTAMRAGGGIEDNSMGFGTGGDDVSLDNVTLDSNQALGGPGNGGALHVSGDAITRITGGSVSGNTAASEGGGLWNSATGQMFVSGGTIIDANTAVDGGGIYSDGGRMVIDGVNITNNVASQSGGGIYLAAGGGNTPDIQLDNSLVDGNIASATVAGQGGGGIFTAGSMFLLNTNVTNNTAIAGTADGGGVLIDGSGFGLPDFSIDGGSISNNRAARAGGGVENNGGFFSSFTGAVLDGNSAGVNGGGLHMSAGLLGVFGVLSDTTISNNTTVNEGGGLWTVNEGTLALINSQVNNNTAMFGGGIFGDGDDPLGSGGISVDDSQIFGNTATVNGGGVATEGGELFLSVVDITDNIANGANVGQGGGGIFSAAALDASSVTLTGNTATVGLGNGGGILITADGTGTFRDGVISGNAAARAGGGFENNGGQISIFDTTIGGATAADGNTAGINGGGLHVSGTGMTVVSGGSVQNNVAGQEGGGLWNGTGTMSVSSGTVISNNSANGNGFDQGGGGIFNNGGTLLVDGITIDANTADNTPGAGGGVLSDGGFTQVINSIVSNNDEYGIRIINGSGDITNNTFTGNVTADLLVDGTNSNDIFFIDATSVTFGANNIAYDGAVPDLDIRGLDGDDTFSVTPSVDTQIFIDGGSPVVPATPGDTLNLTLQNEANVYADKTTGNVSITTTVGAMPTQPVTFVSIETFLAAPSAPSQTVNFIGDNNNTIDQQDNLVIVGRDVDSAAAPIPGAQPEFQPDSDGDNEFTWSFNGSPTFGFRNVAFVNYNSGNLADTLEVTPYADDTPQGWAIDFFYNEGLPNGTDGVQDLLIYNTSMFGGMVSEDILVRPSGPDHGELVVTNGSFGTPIVDIDYTFNTDIIINDNDGFLNDTDTLTLLGSDPSNPGASGNETVVANFTNAGGVGTPHVSVLDGATILYNIRNFTGFNTIDVKTLGGNDSLVFTPDTTNANGLQNVALRYDGGDVVGNSLTVNALNGLRVTPGSDNNSGVVDQLGVGVGNVTYINTGLINATSATAASAVTVRGTNDEDTIAFAPTATANEARVWINGTTTVTANAGGADTNLATINLQGRFADDAFSITPVAGVAVNLDGGDATDQDTVIVHGTGGADVVNYTPASANSGTVAITGLGLVTMTSVEDLTFDGSGGIDTLIVTGTAGSDAFVHQPGAVADAGSVRMNSTLGVAYEDLDATGSITIAGAAGSDTLVAHGTNSNDTFSVAAVTGAVTLVTSSATHVVLNQTNVENLTLDGLDGDDTFNVPGNHPLTTLSVHGGNPDNGSDVLNFAGAGAAITANLASRTVTETGFLPVDFVGIETVNIAAAGAALTADLTANDDELTYRPTGAAAGMFRNENDNTTFNFTNVAGTFTVNALASVGDHLIIEGTQSHDRIAVDSPNRTATVTDATGTVLKTVTMGGDVEIITAMGRDGNDTFTVTPSPTVGGVVNGNLLINVDGGGPGASDALVIATAAGTTLPATDFAVNAVGLNPGEGRVRVFRGAVAMPDISYTNVEIVSPNVVVADGVPQLLVLGPDASEPNEFRTNATHLGAGDSINVDNLAIFPNFGEHPGVPADVDFFQIVAESTGVLDVTAFFEMVAVGLLPGGGDLTLNVLDDAGNVIAGAGAFGNADATSNARVRFPVVQGTTYFVRVTGTAANVVNAYELTVMNEAPPTPFDLELNDILQTGTINNAIAPTPTTFRAGIAPVNGILVPTDFDYALKTVEFTSGPNVGRSATITAFNSVTGQFTVGAGLIAAPTTGDTFLIETTDTGRSQFDDRTRDNTPIITFRLDDNSFRNDLPGNPSAGNPPDEVISIPFNASQAAAIAAGAGFRVPIFIEGGPQQPGTNPQTPIGYARQLAGVPGVYTFDFGDDAIGGPLALTDGSHFIRAAVEIIDPSSPTRYGFGDRSASLQIIVDTTPPPVSFGDPAIVGDGLHPDSDSGDPFMPATLSDGITNVTTPTFFGRGEANSNIKLYLDLDGSGTITGPDILIGQTTVTPFDGTNQEPFGPWEITSTVNFNQPSLGLGFDGPRTVLVQSEDVQGNRSADDLALRLDFFIDTTGPQITDVYPNDQPDFDLFNVKPETPAPTPRVDRLTIKVQDLPNRFADSLYAAISNLPLVANGLPQGLIQLVGDHSGVIKFASVVFTPDAFPPMIPAGGVPATGTITLTFTEPLPDDRFTLTLSDSIIDPVGNALDGESDGAEPGTPDFRTDGVASGDGISGGDFVARFTVDSRPEVGTWSQGLIYVDINGNRVWDPEGQDNDATNRDFVFQFGQISDGLFAGNFASRGANASGFDKIAAYGMFNGRYSFLLDTDDDGVGDVAQSIGVPQVNAAAVAGNFNGNAADGDEVALFDGAKWYVFDIVGTGMVLTNTISASYNGIPLAGDFNGDGNDDFAVYVNDTNTVIFDTNRDGVSDGNLILSDSTGRFAGLSGFTDKPVAGDLNLDGVDDIGIWVKGRQGVLPKEQGEFFFWVSDVQQDATGAFQPDANPLANFTADVNFPAGSTPLGRTTFSPAPLGNDVYIPWGDEFALPIFGNFDPPIAGQPELDLGAATNPFNRFDVNNDGNVTALDALILINKLNEGVTSAEPGSIARLRATIGDLFIDVNGDTILTAVDALQVINELNRFDAGGEAIAAVDPVQSSIPWHTAVDSFFNSENDEDERDDMLGMMF